MVRGNKSGSNDRDNAPSQIGEYEIRLLSETTSKNRGGNPIQRAFRQGPDSGVDRQFLEEDARQFGPHSDGIRAVSPIPLC